MNFQQSARLAWDDAIDQLLKDILRTPLYTSIHHPLRAFLIILLLSETKLFRNNS